MKGGDDINQLCEADENEFKEIVDLVGMTSKPLHVRRLRKAIDEYKNARLSTHKLSGESLFSSNHLFINFTILQFKKMKKLKL